MKMEHNSNYCIEGDIYGLKLRPTSKIQKKKKFEGGTSFLEHVNQVQLLLFHDIWSHLNYADMHLWDLQISQIACQHTFVQSGNTN